MIARLLNGGPQVLATGGGAFMNAATREAIAAQGVSIWLKPDVDVLLARVRKKSNRPLLQTDDPEATLRRLLAERAPTYALADLTIESRDGPHDSVVDLTLRRLARRCSAARRGPSVLRPAPGRGAARSARLYDPYRPRRDRRWRGRKSRRIAPGRANARS